MKTLSIHKKSTNPYARTLLSALIITLTMILSLMVGRYPIHLHELGELARSLFGLPHELSAQGRIILLQIRLPRILAAFLVGGSLSITGATYQGVFRNAMVSPSILGVSSGAGFGAALAILLGMGQVMQQSFAFLFGIGAVAAVYFISMATGKKHDKCLTLILSGMIISTVFSALISLLKYVADPNDTLPSIVYWLMGGLSEVEMSDLRFISIIALVGMLGLSLSGWKLDMLSFGDDEAKTLGINVEFFRLIVIIITTLMTACAVSISGIIGWVGLLVPHISRMMVGSQNAKLLPHSFFLGGVFLMLVDNFSRSISSLELPLGITTSLIGAPFFIFILVKRKKH